MKRRDRDLRGSILLLSEKEKEKEIYRPSLMVGQEVEVEEIEIEMDVIYDMISNKIFFFFFLGNKWTFFSAALPDSSSLTNSSSIRQSHQVYGSVHAVPHSSSHVHTHTSHMHAASSDSCNRWSPFTSTAEAPVSSPGALIPHKARESPLPCHASLNKKA